MTAHRPLAPARRIVGALLFSASAFAQFATPNLFVSTTFTNTIREYSPSGTLVQTFGVPYPGGRPPTEFVRDLAVHSSGDLWVFNGTFSPYLSVRRAATGTWQHYANPAWSTVNFISAGGIAIRGDHVFVPDSFGNGGIFRFDLATSSWQHFATQFAAGFYELTVGYDGLLYATGGVAIEVFDPVTLAHLRTVPVMGGGIAVDGNGHFFLHEDTDIVHRDPLGNEIGRIATGGQQLQDLDLDPCGAIVVGERYGHVFATDTNLTSVTAFVGSPYHNFVAFAARDRQPVLAREVSRLGVPPNPPALLPGVTSGPVIGRVWDPAISPFVPAATFDFLILSFGPDNVPAGSGTILCDFATAIGFRMVPAGAPLSLPLPAHCGFVGKSFSVQGGSISPTLCALANALDITVGAY